MGKIEHALLFIEGSLRAEFLPSGEVGEVAMEGEAQQSGIFTKLAKAPCIFDLPIPHLNLPAKSHQSSLLTLNVINPLS